MRHSLMAKGAYPKPAPAEHDGSADLKRSVRAARNDCLSILYPKVMGNTIVIEKLTKGRYMIKGAIFDMDGTLLDSMAQWRTVGSDYMRGEGVEPPDTLDDDMLRLTLAEAAELIKKCGVNKDAGEIQEGLNARVDGFYRKSAQLRPGVADMLRAFSWAGVKMCVATATDRAQAEAALLRTGASAYIERIFTCTELCTGKHEPKIFDAAREYMATEKADTWVFEDACHAAQTAHRAGYRVCGIFDPSEPSQDELRAAADLYLTTFEGAEKYFGI